MTTETLHVIIRAISLIKKNNHMSITLMMMMMKMMMVSMITMSMMSLMPMTILKKNGDKVEPENDVDVLANYVDDDDDGDVGDDDDDVDNDDDDENYDGDKS